MSTNTAVSAPPPAHIRIASAIFEIEAGEPGRHARMALKMVCVMFVLLLVWASVAKLDIVAVARGRLIPQTYVKIVQPADSGIVREILVQEGDEVQKNQVLVRLDPTINGVDSTAIDRELALQRLQLRRIEAELRGVKMERRDVDDPVLFAQVEAQRVSHQQAFVENIAQETAALDRSNKELSAAQEVLTKLATTLPSYQRSADAYQKLANDGLVGAIQAEEKRRDAIEKERDLESQRATVESLRASITQHDRRISQLRSSQASDLNQQRLEVITEITRLEQQSTKLGYQRGLLELRAPQAGTVKDLATTTLGAVVQPGTVLVSLVPQGEALLAEIMIENKDIGFVAPGQPVRVKLDAYQFQKYGMLEGVVKKISADSSSANDGNTNTHLPEQQPRLFKALVELKQQRLENGGTELPLAAGMQLAAEMVQGKRTVLEYLLSPVQRVANEAATER